jgi:hypothetical protein
VSTTRELPPLSELTQRQQRGVDCVFCGVPLVAGDITNLGPLPLMICDYQAEWYPRAHPRCAAE